MRKGAGRACHEGNVHVTGAPTHPANGPSSTPEEIDSGLATAQTKQQGVSAAQQGQAEEEDGGEDRTGDWQAWIESSGRESDYCGGLRGWTGEGVGAARME